jgi:hypothetical protein
MAFNVGEFRANLVGDGARPNLFQVTMAFPTFATDSASSSRALTFLCKTAQLPGSTVNMVPLYYFGRELKFSGNRNFADWSITVINDENFKVRKAFESWMNGLNSHATNLRNPLALNAGGAGQITGYSVDAKVDQFDKAGNIIKTYKFVGSFPIDLTPIDVDWGSNDTIEEFGVTLAYQWWESDTTS